MRLILRAVAELPELAERHRGGAAHGVGLAALRPFERYWQRALVLQFGEAEQRRRADHVVLRLLLHRHLRQHVERLRRARLPERVRCGALDEVAGVALAQHADQRSGRALLAELPERRDDAATRLRVPYLHAGQQRRERDLRAHRAQRARRLGLHAPELVLQHGVLQRIGGLLRAELRQFARRIDAPRHVVVVLELVEQHLLAALELDRLEEVVARVEAHHVRFAQQREVEVVRLLGDLHVERMRFAIDREIDDRGQPKDRRLVLVLRLLHVELRLLRRVVPLERQLERRVPAFVDVLIKQPVDVAPGRLGDRALEVGRRDVRAAVLAHVVMDRLRPAGVAEHRADHVEDERPLLVQMAVEEVDRFVIDVVDDRAAVAVAVFAHVDLRVAVQLVAELVDAFVALGKQRLEVRREALVQPAMRPVAARQQVAEPLMRQLVRQQSVRVGVE